MTAHTGAACQSLEPMHIHHALLPARTSIWPQNLCLWCRRLHQECSTWGGVKWHIQKQHLHSRIHPQPADPTEIDEEYQDYDFPDGVDLPGLDEPDAGVGQHPRVRKVSYHPLLDGAYDLVDLSNTSTYHCHAGTPCDHAGHYLPLNSPPPLNPSPLPGDYGPYESRAAFELAEFLYSCEQMPAAKIDELLAIMASMYNNDPPFRSHKDMYNTIDATRHGDSPWQSFSVTYSGTMPDDPPSWMTAKYDVWFHDPKVVLEHQLANPDFKGEIDYAAKVVVDEDGHHEVCDLMSGQWAFEQSVSSFFLVAAQVSNFKPADLRTLLPRMPTPMVRCLCQWFSAVTKLQSRLRWAIQSTTPFTSHLGTYTIMSAERIVMLYRYLHFSLFPRVRLYCFLDCILICTNIADEAHKNDASSLRFHCQLFHSSIAAGQCISYTKQQTKLHNLHNLCMQSILKVQKLMKPPLSMQHLIKQQAWQIECQHGVNKVFQSALDSTHSLKPGWGDMTLVPCILSQSIGNEVNYELTLSSISRK